MATARHTLHVCTRCRAGALPSGIDLLGELARALDGAADFAVSGIGCMAGCDRPVAVGFSAPGKAGYLFGGIDASRIGPLLQFARLYASLPDGWTSEARRPAGLAGTIIARIPAPVVLP